MPRCRKHRNFEIEHGVYYRSADAREASWKAKSEPTRVNYYAAATSGDLNRLAEVVGEAQLIHSQESSAGSAFISVARCPLCLIESKDGDVQGILAANPIYKIKIAQRNSLGKPYVFDMEGEGVGAGETESLVLLPDGASLKSYWPNPLEFVTVSYLKTLK